jgi:hypothetical protein
MKTQKQSPEYYKSKALAILTRHIGEEKAIDMGELYRRVYGKEWKHKINDTRKLRTLITKLRYEGCLIGSTRSQCGGGYYIARSASELNEFFERRTHEALKILSLISSMKHMGLDEMLGQMALNLRARKEHGNKS